MKFRFASVGYLLGCCALLIVSCEKESNLPQFQSNLLIGDTTQIYNNPPLNKLIITEHAASITGSYHKPTTYNIDLNSDGQPDVRFITEVTGSPAMGMKGVSTLECLHPNVQLYGYNSDDSSFLHVSYGIMNLPNGKIEKTKIYNYTCERISASDSVLVVQRKGFLHQLNENDRLTQTSNFIGGKHRLTNFDYNSPSRSNTGMNGDTTYYDFSTYKQFCNAFPTNKDVYVGFKFNHSKLGWIKFKIPQNHIVSILESAIQR